MTITINSLTISGSEIIIGYDKQSQSDLTGKGYFYRIAGKKPQDYNIIGVDNLTYVIDFWGNTLFPLKSGDTDYTKTPFYKYPINSKDMNAMNLLGPKTEPNNVKNTLFCVGGAGGFNPNKILTYLKSSSGQEIIKSYNGIVLDIEMVTGVVSFYELWITIKSICDYWTDKYIIFCVAGSGYSTFQYKLIHESNNNQINFIAQMYMYISTNLNAYLAPMLYDKKEIYGDNQFSDNAAKTCHTLYKTHQIHKSLLPIYFNTKYSESNMDSRWDIQNYDNYMIWPSNPSELKTNPIYLSPDCPYDFSNMFCPHKDKKTPVKGTCDKTCGLDKGGNLMYCSNISSYCESPNRPPFECAAKRYTQQIGQGCFTVMDKAYPKQGDLYKSSVTKYDKTASKSNATYCKGKDFFALNEKGAIWKNGKDHRSNTSYLHYARGDSSFNCSTYQTPETNVYILTEDEKNMTPCSDTYTSDDILLICPKSTPLPPNSGPCDCYECATSSPRTYGICSPAIKSCDVANGSAGNTGCYTNAPSNCDCSINAYNKSDEKIKQSRWKCQSSTNPLSTKCIECDYNDLTCPYATKSNCQNKCQLRSKCDNSSPKGLYNPMCVSCAFDDTSCPFTNILNSAHTQCDKYCHPKSGYEYNCGFSRGIGECTKLKGTNQSKAQCQATCHT